MLTFSLCSDFLSRRTELSANQVRIQCLVRRPLSIHFANGPALGAELVDVGVPDHRDRDARQPLGEDDVVLPRVDDRLLVRVAAPCTRSSR